ncbi:MAG TPA: hypothetical protein VMV69_22385 [Pirellulales bacterium]|nr:hypothetical protein [Pirellulales bacterium]
MHANRRISVQTAVLTAVLTIALVGFMDEATAQPPRMNAGLSYLLGLFQLRVVAGRITVSGATSFQTHKGEFKTNDRHERLELTQAGAATTFHYESTTPQAQLTWDLLAGNEVRIRRLPRGVPARKTGAPTRKTGVPDQKVPDRKSGGADAKLVVFGQPAEGFLSLSVGEGYERKEYRGATIWHLFLAEPELCRNELAPLLQIMKPGWNLVERAQNYEMFLFRSADIQRQPSRGAWLRLVADLGHEKFSRRQAADRRLRIGGSELLPFLLSLDLDRLDAEQRFRVGAIMRSSAVKEDDAGKVDDDTPNQIIRPLRDDPIVWIELLARDDEQKRRIAGKQLSRLLNEVIDFDPAAEADQRKKQIDALRRRVRP